MKPQRLFYAIGEVSQLLGETQATLKYWEREFDHIHPKTTARGTRQYTQKDIEALRAIQRLLRQKGLTISGAKAELRQRKAELELREQALNRLEQSLKKLKVLYASLEEHSPIYK